MLVMNARACKECQEMSVILFRFRTSISPYQLSFNHEAAINMMLVKTYLILYIVHTHTGFQSATALQGKAVDDIWFLFNNCCATLYTGYPSLMHLNQETCFTAKAFPNLATVHGILVQFSGVLTRIAIDSSEKHHKPLQRAFLTLRQYFPKL